MQALRDLLAQPAPNRKAPRYDLLDLARGLAAFAVLIWHYQHFYLRAAGEEFPEALRTQQPLFPVLRPLYLHGYMAVSFFWLISGFVFAAVYAGHRPTARAFAISRLARLYPLHLLTLAVVAILQWTSFHLDGEWQIYRHNDVPHFIAHLFMASNWLSAVTFSFNGPIWSVSIEVLFYALFWLTLPFLYRRGIVGPIVIAAACWLLARIVALEIVLTVECGQYFFEGAACCLISRSMADRAAGGIGAVFLIGGILTYRVSPIHVDSLSLPLWLGGALLLLAAFDARYRRALGNRLGWIGDSTYGVYLWHVPLQIAALIVLDHFIGSRDVVSSPLFLAGFIATSIMAARLSFLFFELPMRRWIRRLGGLRQSRGLEPDAGIPAP